MVDLYLKAESEADMKAALPWAVNENGEWITATHQWALDPVGAIVKTPAVLLFDPPSVAPLEYGVGDDDDGEGEPVTITVIAEATYAPGYHANLRLLDDTLTQLVPDEIVIAAPSSPARVWA